ncbi:hypothetical protein [Clostridium cellulovorans]|uniref:Uncharacterized protein n=1 Tax=Clostridium cellulovorans (strain ATCC 35296 / DSM 3052 / OCM 3 / 743B) TaxID=573061 RepID=D9SS10_CLOC7|nr:hypothetical protein [Clostridium cellulovorans]ADL52457.1 hypothetical protein Clocel_2760 [Clostridium cellulovorans 743B]
MKRKLVFLLICSVAIAGAIGIYRKAVATTNTLEVTSSLNDSDDSVSSELEDSIPAGMDEKETIQYKMLNSIDLFEYAFGNFEYYSKGAPALLVEYVVDNRSGKSYTNIRSADETNDFSIEDIFKDRKCIHIINKDKTYKESETTAISKEYEEENKKLKLKEKISIAEDGNKIYSYRQDPNFMGMAEEVLFNQSITFGLLEDSTKWNINGVDTYLNIECFNISGELTDSYSQKLKGTKFNLLVDKNRGVILKLEVVDDSNNVGFSIKSLSMNVDDENCEEGSVSVSINDKKFDKDLSSYRKMSNYIQIGDIDTQS